MYKVIHNKARLQESGMASFHDCLQSLGLESWKRHEEGSVPEGRKRNKRDRFTQVALFGVRIWT